MTLLAGQRVVVTRPLRQAEELAAPLRALGAEVIVLPVIAISPPADIRPLRTAVERLNDYDWIVFSSANAVSAFERELGSNVQQPRARIAVIGKATCHAVEKLGWKVDMVPGRFFAEALADQFSEESLRGQRVLLPAAAVTRDILPRALMDKGAIVDVVEAYRNVMPDDIAMRAERLFSMAPRPDWVTFTSSSAVDNLVTLVGVNGLRGVKIACIGPVTAASVETYNLRVDAQPHEHSVTALVQAMVG
jgi:uroporphyrinogen III methyltransferase/synthase